MNCAEMKEQAVIWIWYSELLLLLLVWAQCTVQCAHIRIKGLFGKFRRSHNVGRQCRAGFRPTLPVRRNLPRKPFKSRMPKCGTVAGQTNLVPAKQKQP